MTTSLKLAGAALIAITLAACAQAVATQPPSYEPPPRKQADAKTQLESGRRY